MPRHPPCALFCLTSRCIALQLLSCLKSFPSVFTEFFWFVNFRMSWYLKSIKNSLYEIFKVLFWLTRLSVIRKFNLLSFLMTGNHLLSRVVSNQVPSALKGLTSVFGMGTGGSLSPLSPECWSRVVQAFVLLASVPSLYNRDFHLGNPPHNRASLFYCAYPENRTSRF